MKHTKLTLILLLALTLVLSACGNNNKSNNQAAEGDQVVTLKVGATAVPHAEILNFVAPTLLEQGVKLDVIEFTDFVLPNTQLHEKELDANFFQHLPYLESMNEKLGYDLVNVAGVHVEPFGIYSNSITDIADLPHGAKIAIPNDPTNGGRSLLLLAQHGLLELNEEAGIEATVSDITSNPHEFEFIELEAATLPRVLDEVSIAAINTNYALEAGFNPTKDALIIEDSESPYVNILAARPDNKDNEAIKKLVAALQTEEVATFINEKYEGSVVPAFQ